MAEFVKAEGKTIGVIINGIFRKEVSGSLHHVRHPAGWATDAFAWDEIGDKLIGIMLHDTETDDYYSMTVDEFMANCMLMDRGFGLQYFVADECWHHHRR